MNHKMLLCASAICLALLSAPQAKAQLPSSGTWGDHTVSGEESVTLTGDVTITGCITILAGAKLTIRGGGHTITPRSGLKSENTGLNTPSVVSIKVHGTLDFQGDADNHIKVTGLNSTANVGYDGLGGDVDFNARFGIDREDFQYVDKNASSADGLHYASKFIYQEGTDSKLYLKNVDFKDILGFNISHGAILTFWGASMTNPLYAEIENVNISNCFAWNGTALIMCDSSASGSVTMKNCHISNSTSCSYGGIIAGMGGTPETPKKFTLTMDGCEMDHCMSSGWGGAILWATAPQNDSRLILKNCHFHHNYARCLGGALSCEGKMELTGCTIENNFAGFGGGGIAAFPYTLSGSGTGEAVGLSLIKDNIIRNNTTINNTNTGTAGRFDAFSKTYPAGGGGVWVLMNMDKWSCNAHVDATNEISGNESANSGGGVLLYKAAPSGLSDYTSGGDTSLTTNAKISDNTALSGGGVAIGADGTLSLLPTVCVNSGEISGNTASNGNGGGIYMPGGVFEMTDGVITGNMAKASSSTDYTAGNGGGFAIKNGTVKVSGASEITLNNCDHYGAGLYVNNDGSYATGFEGGRIHTNGKTSCLAGGGICVNGNSSFTTSGTNIETNYATNGGGICVIGGAQMTYKAGLIRNNFAKKTADMKGQTANGKGVTEVSGIGGGVFVADSGSKLSFDVKSDFGLYGNTADKGADDIFANGNGTTIELPDVSSMNLTGYEINLPSKALYWVEDYIEDDADYTSGTNVMGGNYPGTDHGLALKNWRYRYALDREDYGIYTIDGPQTLTCYTSLALGYHIVYITVVKSGMKPGHNALFKIKSEGSAKDYMTFLLKTSDKVSEQPDGTITLQKRVRLISGEWTVWEDESWSWAYTATGTKTYTRTLDKDSTADDLRFEFSNKFNDDLPPLNEDVKVNRIDVTK